MSEKTIGAVKYRIPRLPAMPQQYTLARKLSGVLALLALQKDQKKLEESFPTAFCALTERISQEDSNLIIGTCLSGVTRQETGGAVWAPIWVDGACMYADMSLRVQLQLIWYVLVENELVSFFSETLSNLDKTTAASGGSDMSAAG